MYVYVYVYVHVDVDVDVDVDTPCTQCVDSKRLRVYVQNVPVCTGTTRTCVSTCARVARLHGDVLNVDTEAC